MNYNQYRVNDNEKLSIKNKLNYHYTLLLSLLKMSKSWTSPPHAENLRQVFLTFLICGSYGIFL
jgi:hypothetical protein